MVLRHNRMGGNHNSVSEKNGDSFEPPYFAASFLAKPSQDLPRVERLASQSLEQGRAEW